MDIEQAFVERLGSSNLLVEYLSFITNTSLTNDVYNEEHHILPKSVFPEYEDSEWNLIRLPYTEHVKAHVLLAQAYPINEFINPLRFMRHDLTNEEYRELRSKGSKNGWRKLKEDSEKFDSFKSKRSAHMKAGHARVMSEKAAQNWVDNNERRQTTSEQMKDSWKETRNRRVSSMKEAFNKPEHIERQRANTKQRWETRQDADEQKRLLREQALKNQDSVAERNRELWATEEYQQRMKAARSGFFWWTDGNVEIKAKDQPEGFVRGRLASNKTGRLKNET